MTMASIGPARARLTRVPTEGAGAAGVYYMTSDLSIVDRSFTGSVPTFTTVTADASANTKGAYSQLIASTSGTVTMIRLTLKNTQTTTASTNVLVDIATGAGGAEVVQIANITCGFLSDASNGVWTGQQIWFPISIASGTRIAARCQAETGGDTVDVHITTFSGMNKTPSAIDTIGAVTASSRGTNFTPGSATKGSYTEVTASTSNAYTGLVYAFGGGGDSTHGNNDIIVDIATGAAASETVQVPNVYLNDSSTERMTTEVRGPLSLSIGSGTRIAVRGQSTAGTPDSQDIVLFGLRD